MLIRRIATVAVALLVAARSLATAEKSAAETVRALDAERTRAMVAGDVAALDRIFATDALYTHSTGIAESKSEFIGKIQSGDRKYRSMACRDVRVRVAGGAAIVTGNVDGEVEVGGKSVSLSLVFTAVYLQKAGRWELASYQSTKLPEAGKKEAIVPHHATGAFDVKMAPQEAEEGTAISRFSLDKRYRGPLEATARGEMLTVMTGVKGSAGYVAMEQVEGTLDGRRGSFALQHSATMNRDARQLSITVVPDSGTGELAGLAGTLAIRIDEGKHFYDFEYTLP